MFAEENALKTKPRKIQQLVEVIFDTKSENYIQTLINGLL